jgi:hypothetical protein
MIAAAVAATERIGQGLTGFCMSCSFVDDGYLDRAVGFGADTSGRRSGDIR